MSADDPTCVDDLTESQKAEYYDYLYENRRINNGDDLICALEDTQLFNNFVKEKLL